MAYPERDQILPEVPESIKSKMNSKKTIILIVVIALVAGFTGGFYFNQYRIAASPKNLPIVNKDAGEPKGVDFGIFWDTWNLLQKKYVDKQSLDTQKMIYGAVEGMVNSIGDPYTTFFQPQESESFISEINGSFGGVGIEIGMRNSIITVIAPIKGTPAEKAGVIAGDKITKIGDKTTDGMSVNDAVNTIRGPRGTSVKLTIAREGDDKLIELTITRDIIKIPAAEWKMLNDDVAYIQMYVF